MQLHSLTQALIRHAKGHGSVAFVSGAAAADVLTFGALHQLALELLAGFHAQGVQAFDEVVIYTDDNREFIIGFWACLFGAMIPVPIAVGHHGEHQQKLFNILHKLAKPFLYTNAATLSRLKKFAESSGQSWFPAQPCLFAQHKSETPAKVHAEAGAMQRLAFIQFSSGSTREPKGVMITHANLVANIQAMRTGAKYCATDKILSWMPLTHDMGLIGMHLAPLYCNMDHYLMPTALFSRRPLVWLKAASQYKCSILCSPNFGYKHYLKALGDKNVDDLNLSAVRLIYNGAEPISTDLCRRFLQRLAPCQLRKQAMFLVYGLAEATLAVSFPKIDCDYKTVTVNRQFLSLGATVQVLEPTAKDAVQFALVGAAVSSCAIRITVAGQGVAEGVVGEVHIVGQSVTSGYYQEVRIDRQGRDAQWFNTGDIGFMFEGELVITGRAKEIIFAHGQNYYPQDMEAIIHREVGLDLGRVAACAVRENQQQNEQLLIFVVFRQSLHGFLAIVKAINKALSSLVGLDVFAVIPVKKLPKTTSGKLQRTRLVQAYQQGEFAEVMQALAKLSQPSVALAVNKDSMANKLLTILQQVVPDKSIAVHEDLFESGLSSLQLTEFHQMIDAVYPDKIDITDVLDLSTLQDIALLIEKK